MKALILVRHADAIENHKGDTIYDFYRKITMDGKQEVKQLIKELEELELIPDRIISSSSRRTYQTTMAIGRGLGVSGKSIVFTSDIYMSDYQSYLDEIYATQDDIDILMIVGHNPGISDLFNYLNQDKTLFHTGQKSIIRYSTSKRSDINKTNQIV